MITNRPGSPGVGHSAPPPPAMDFPAAKWLKVEQVEARFRAVVVDHLTFHLHFCNQQKAHETDPYGGNGQGWVPKGKRYEEFGKVWC